MNELTETLIKIDNSRKYGLYRIRLDRRPTIIKDLTPQEANDFVVSTHYINDFFVLLERVVKAEMNYDDLVKAAERNFEFDATQKHFQDRLKTTKLDLVNANRLCSSYVYSWFNCVELMELQVKKVHGQFIQKPEKTAKFLAWEEIKRGYFNSRFEYRFVYTARNYQHLENLIAGIYYGSDGKQRPVPMLSKPYLTSFDDFKKQAFANDWQGCPNRIPALPIFSGSTHVLKEVSEKHLELSRDFYLSHANPLYAKYGRYAGWVIGIAVKPSYGIKPTQEFQEVQVDFAKHVIDYYSQHPTEKP